MSNMDEQACFSCPVQISLVQCFTNKTNEVNSLLHILHWISDYEQNKYKLIQYHNFVLGYLL